MYAPLEYYNRTVAAFISEVKEAIWEPQEGCNQAAIDAFKYNFGVLASGTTGPWGHGFHCQALM